MNNLSTIGRILFAIPFGLFGLNHIFLYDWYIGNFTSFIPIGPFTVALTGVLMILACISIIVQKFVMFTTHTLAGMLFLFIIAIHIPHLLQGDDTTMVTITLLKDISLMGGCLMIAGMYAKKNLEKDETLKQ
jgi:putative oxidoreductase